VWWERGLPQVGHLGVGVVMHLSMVRAEVPVHLKYGRGGSGSRLERYPRTAWSDAATALLIGLQ
jgi:hypothetical protein